MWTTTDYDRPQQRVACAAVGSCELVVQPFDGHSSIGSASITGSTTSRALPSASHPCGLFGGSVHQLRHSFSISSRFGSETASILLNSRDG